jgi:hypothetical protein
MSKRRQWILRTTRLAKQIVESYRQGVIARPGMSVDDLWSAKYLYDSAFHPDTKEKMFILGRMSAQGIPAAFPLAFSSLLLLLLSSTMQYADHGLYVNSIYQRGFS